MSVRGDVTVSLGGQNYRLLLTLGAMAAIEESLKVENIGEAIDRISAQNIKALKAFLQAAADAGGNQLSDDAFNGLDYLEASSAAGALLGAAFGAADADKDDGADQERSEPAAKN